ncbi:CDF family Co(II)/Ni(II) efflux transporter DmeF [Rivihabitans pingtungensis]|uniref:CDF family Co(II)/Ni(II) efflux transporter DmeF n=1 Tax=Rivihabitans pingtungensis TaxID=1054498 RepID=UPI00235530D1|nr:CDF family Co(II)/Ni(II) efflux transporter DmeF [Rivihabitans pingtungensis]MCK6436088.1 CDF family Co(II)/Ni(II) efflux transporter DmeF [Rivihabitans pingtungensis]
MSPSPRYRRPGLPPLPAGFAARHAHDFLGADHQRNARRVGGVMALTLAMMVGEILAGTWFGSMALLADGWHMATHAGAMLITVLAYRYAQRAAGEARHSFGAGKVGDLAGFASALILIGVALIMAWESVARLLAPTPIEYGEAIAVAALGLAVNLASAWLLRDDHAHHHHGHDHGHSHAGHHHHDHHDHNLRAAYLHVLADALTSVLAIVALLLGQRYGWSWLDPVMGLVGAVVIVRWGRGLLHSTADVLLDAAPSGMTEAITQALGDDVGVLDLHVWQIGPGQHAAIVALSAARPASPAAYKARLTGVAGLAHVNVEVHAA